MRVGYDEYGGTPVTVSVAVKAIGTSSLSLMVFPFLSTTSSCAGQAPAA